jgi:uracil-DNA glycosylase family 4
MPETIAALEDRITCCRLCPRLVAYREEVARTKKRAFLEEPYWGRPVPGFGDPRARVLVVGLAPGPHGSNRTGRMFTGDASGDFLFPALHRAGFCNRPVAAFRDDGLTLSQMFISAVCRCVPPGNKPAPGEIRNCLPYLAEELILLGAVRVIVALGKIAYDASARLLAEDCRREKPAFGHGVEWRAEYLREGKHIPVRIIASYHPSRQNTQTKLLSPEMFDRIWKRASLLAEKD